MKVKTFLILLLLFIIVTISWADESEESEEVTYEEAQRKHESENPVFMQKGGMMGAGEHAFYIRTNDEWTGFSTFLVGYRFGVNKAFNIAVEGGASPIPHVYLASVILHFKLFETKNRFFFIGLRIRAGYKYQDSDFSVGLWPRVVGNNYLTVKRNGFYLAPDLTFAFRFGPYRRFCLYHTIYPRFDFDLFNKEEAIWVLFSPIMAGFEVRFPKKRFRWSFAVEAGYTFPIPWNGIPAGKWVNFPSLANVSFSYRFGDKFYSKDNLARLKRDN